MNLEKKVYILDVESLGYSKAFSNVKRLHRSLEKVCGEACDSEPFSPKPYVYIQKKIKESGIIEFELSDDNDEKITDVKIKKYIINSE